MLPKQHATKGFMSNPYHSADWNISSSQVRFQANSVSSPTRSSALFSILTLPRHDPDQILSLDNNEDIHLDAQLHPFFRDQVLCIFFFLSPPLFSLSFFSFPFFPLTPFLF